MVYFVGQRVMTHRMAVTLLPESHFNLSLDAMPRSRIKFSGVGTGKGSDPISLSSFP